MKNEKVSGRVDYIYTSEYGGEYKQNFEVVGFDNFEDIGAFMQLCRMHVKGFELGIVNIEKVANDDSYTDEDRN